MLIESFKLFSIEFDWKESAKGLQIIVWSCERNVLKKENHNWHLIDLKRLTQPSDSTFNSSFYCFCIYYNILGGGGVPSYHVWFFSRFWLFVLNDKHNAGTHTQMHLFILGIPNSCHALVLCLACHAFSWTRSCNKLEIVFRTINGSVLLVWPLLKWEGMAVHLLCLPAASSTENPTTNLQLKMMTWQ